ncbi:MAG: MFS transporter, partial [Candidatus Nephrothrix sp. EaCA]
MNEPDEKAIRAWCMYDWANSVYNLVITTTFFPVYYDLITEKAYGNDIPFLGRTFKSTALYSYAVSFSYLAIAICLPWLTALADASGSKKRFMQFFTYLGSAACIGLY